MKPDILILNAYILTEPGRANGVEHGYVAVSNGRIHRTGPMEEMQGPDAVEIIDARGGVVMPGLVNTHCHAAMTLFRGLADDLELVSWLNDHIFPAEAAHVNPEMVYQCSKLAAAEMILSGTTLVADGYFFEAVAARAFCEVGLRAVAAQGIIDFPAPGVPGPQEAVQNASRFLDDWKEKNPLITPALFAHSPYTCSAHTLTKAKDLARIHNVPFFIHVAEGPREHSMIQDARGATPVQHLDALGILDERTVCVHCVWIDDKDIAILAGHNAKVSICPQSHMKLASGLAPLADMLDNGVVVGLGTDGAASNNGLDLFREMDICAKAQKVKSMDPVAVQASRVLKMATTSGAEALGCTNIGTLKEGAIADLILVDIDRPHLQPFYGPDLLVYSAGGADVRTVIIDGALVVRDRQVVNIDLEETMAAVRRLAQSLM